MDLPNSTDKHMFNAANIIVPMYVCVYVCECVYYTICGRLLFGQGFRNLLLILKIMNGLVITKQSEFN